MRTLVFWCVLLTSGLPVWAGTTVFTFGGSPVTLTTNANQDAYLARLLVKENQARASAVPPRTALTLEQFVRDIFVAELQERKSLADTAETTDFCTSYNAASGANQTTVRTIGGGNNPCP